MRKESHILLPVLLMLVAAVYALAWHGPFQFDDYATVAVDPGAQSLAAWWAHAGQHVRPLTKLSFVLTHALGQWLDHVPLGHRIGNLLIHLLGITLLTATGLRIAQTCLPQMDARRAALAALAALAAAALFGLHPLATEAVSYISGRSMALGTLLATASLYAYIRWRTDRGGAWSALALTTAAAAVLARETALVTPLLWALWELARHDPETAPYSAARLRGLQHRAALPLLIIAAAAAWLLLHVRYAPLLDISSQIAAGRLGEPTFIQAISYFASSLVLLRYPNIDPDLAPALLSPAHRLLVTLALAGLMVAAWRVRRTRPHLLFSALWVIVWLCPVYALPLRYDAVAERHFYPAIWGVAWALCVEAQRLTQHHPLVRKPVTVIALLAVLSYAVVTLTRVADYRSEAALWEAAYRGSPNKVRVLNNLGYAYMEAGRWDEAQALLTRAVQLDPRDVIAQDNLLTAEERAFGPVRWRRRSD